MCCEFEFGVFLYVMLLNWRQKQLLMSSISNLDGRESRTILYKFSARNTNMFALFGLSCTRFAVTICPALLKSLSVGALLAGVARYRRAQSFSWNFQSINQSINQSIRLLKPNCNLKEN